jgi:hypothetical protein
MLTPFTNDDLTPTAMAPGFIAKRRHKRASGTSPDPEAVRTPDAHAHTPALVAVTVAVVRPLEEPDLMRRCTGLCLGKISGLYWENMLDPRKAAVFRR